MKLVAVPTDTTPEAAWVQRQIYQRMSGEERLILALEMGDAVRKKVAAAIRERHPDYSEELVKYAEFRLHLGHELFEKAFPAVHVPSCGKCCDPLPAMYS